MYVKDLIEALNKADPMSEVELNVYGHVYNSVRDRMSHGPMEVLEHHGVVQLHGTSMHDHAIWTVLARDPERRW